MVNPQDKVWAYTLNREHRADGVVMIPLEGMKEGYLRVFVPSWGGSFLLPSDRVEAQ